MQIIGLVGLPGSGKGEAASVAREAGIPVVSMGDVVREETAQRGLDPTKDHGSVAQAMREEDGPGAVADRTLPAIDEALTEADTVVVDGIRSDHEADSFAEAYGEDFTLVSIEAPFELRRERLADRGRDAGADNGGEPLAERDERELGFGMGEAMAQADIVVENTDSLDRFHERIETILAGPDSRVTES